MKLALKIDGSPKSPSFRPGDAVTGTVEVCGRFNKCPPRITATLRGKFRVVVAPQANGCCPIQLTHTTLELSKELQYSDTESHDKESTAKGTLQCRLDLAFPKSGRCCANNATCRPPPSVHIHEAGTRIISQYFLVITAEPPGLFKSVAKKSIKRELYLTCDPPLSSMPRSCTASLSATKLSDALGDVQPSCNCCLPAYSPSLQVQVILPRPPVLIRGQAAPLRLLFHTPHDLLRRETIYVRSVSIKLQTLVTASLGPVPRQAMTSRQICSINGAVRINNERFELDLGAWSGLVVPDSQPTHSSCLLAVTNFVTVTAGVSKGLKGTVQYVQASLEVLVMDPPPSYEARCSSTSS